MRKYIFSFLLTMAVIPATAVEENPNLAQTVDFGTALERPQIKKIIEAQGVLMAAHIVLRKEIEGTNSYHIKFNAYLDQFKKSIALAAQLYGIYWEIKRTVELTGQINNILANRPANAVAVVISSSGGISIYDTIIDNAYKAFLDIYSACLNKEKLTEQDRNVIVERIRNRIVTLNKSLTHYAMLLQVTSIERVISNIFIRARYNRATLQGTIDACFATWKTNGQARI